MAPISQDQSHTTRCWSSVVCPFSILISSYISLIPLIVTKCAETKLRQKRRGPTWLTRKSVRCVRNKQELYHLSTKGCQSTHCICLPYPQPVGHLGPGGDSAWRRGKEDAPSMEVSGLKKLLLTQNKGQNSAIISRLSLVERGKERSL